MTLLPEIPKDQSNKRSTPRAFYSIWRTLWRSNAYKHCSLARTDRRIESQRSEMKRSKFLARNPKIVQPLQKGVPDYEYNSKRQRWIHPWSCTTRQECRNGNHQKCDCNSCRANMPRGHSHYYSIDMLCNDETCSLKPHLLSHIWVNESQKVIKEKFGIDTRKTQCSGLKQDRIRQLDSRFSKKDRNGCRKSSKFTGWFELTLNEVAIS